MSCIGTASASRTMLATAPAGHAHPLDPALADLVAEGSGLRVLWRAPRPRGREPPLVLVLPAACRRRGRVEREIANDAIIERWHASCRLEDLAQATVRIEGLAERGTDALLRTTDLAGQSWQTVLRARAPSATLPRAPSVATVLWAYSELGFAHIFEGLDHLVFVLGLVLLCSTKKILLWTVTAFTLGHSLTLAAATLGWIAIPQAPAEIAIAASIVALGLTLDRQAQGARSGLCRRPWWMAFGFGLLHGLGFASALGRVGLPAGEIPVALFAFNSGIELGQLAFVAICLATSAMLARLPASIRTAMAPLPAHVVGALGAFWVLDRTLRLLGAG